MSSEPGDSTGGGATQPTMVEDLFLTDTFLIKGRLAGKYHRLSKILEDTERTFLEVEDAVMVSLRGNEIVRTPSVQVNRQEIILAHELLEFAGDDSLRTLADNRKTNRIRAFYSGAVQMEISGSVEPGAYEPSRGPGRRFFIMQAPNIRGLQLAGVPELELLKSLSYAIIQKERLSFIYDFSYASA